jgi:opacity protein-like surface antigen
MSGGNTPSPIGSASTAAAASERAATASVFAWQVGTGVTWRITPHATLDLGYRYLDLGVASTPLALANGAAAGNYTSALSASEWLLSVRVYEPLAMLRR